MEVLQNPVVWRVIERVLMVVGGIVLGIIGYRRFIFGSAEPNMFKRVMFGTGPGLVCMGCGAAILITGLLKGGGSSQPIKEDPSGPTYEVQIPQPEPQEMATVGEDSDTGTQSRGLPPAVAGEVLWKKAAVSDGENGALVAGNFAVQIPDFTPLLLAPEDRYVLADLGEEFIHSHAITEFEKKVHNWSGKEPHPVSKSDLLPPRSPRARPN